MTLYTDIKTNVKKFIALSQSLNIVVANRVGVVMDNYIYFSVIRIQALHSCLISREMTNKWRCVSFDETGRKTTRKDSLNHQLNYF